MAHPSHVQFMGRALELAQKARGQTSPNPMVGAVLVKNGKILAEGYHRRAGTDHAEVIAVKKLASKQLKGATLYVTMEPCSIYGKTPPCVPLVIRSGIKRVVIGARDPNPKVDGRGLRLLKKAGIQVVEGVLRKECRQLNQAFEKWVTTGMPLVTLKVAMTLDGKIAASNGHPRWISNRLSRQYVHQIRGEVDAILIGAGTLRKDDPLLTVRLVKNHRRGQPTVIVLDGRQTIPKEARLFTVKNRKVILASSLVTKQSGRIPLKNLLKALGKKNITHLLVEGGAQIYSSFIAEKRVDRLIIFVAPKRLGPNALGWLNLPAKNLQQTLGLDSISIKQLGDNLMVKGELKNAVKRSQTSTVRRTT